MCYPEDCQGVIGQLCYLEDCQSVIGQLCYCFMQRISSTLLYKPPSTSESRSDSPQSLTYPSSQPTFSPNQQAPESITTTTTMPDQGPGTKIVMKGLRRAFPKTAAKRDREEREEREAREASRKQALRKEEDRKEKQTSREQASRKDDEDRRQGPSSHSGSTHRQIRSRDDGKSRRGSSLLAITNGSTNDREEGDARREVSRREQDSKKYSRVEDESMSKDTRHGSSKGSQAGGG